MKNAPALLAVGLVLALSLTACGGATPSVDTSASDPGTDSSSDGTSSDDTAAVTLPDGFPSDEVPIIDGEIVGATHAGNIWAVWVASDDLAGDMEAATALLVDAGYENVLKTDGYRDFHGSHYQVHVTAKDDPTYGNTIAYAFYEVQ